MTYAILFALSCAHALKLHLLHSAVLLPPWACNFDSSSKIDIIEKSMYALGQELCRPKLLIIVRFCLYFRPNNDAAPVQPPSYDEAVKQ